MAVDESSWQPMSSLTHLHRNGEQGRENSNAHWLQGLKRILSELFLAQLASCAIGPSTTSHNSIMLDGGRKIFLSLSLHVHGRVVCTPVCVLTCMWVCQCAGVCVCRRVQRSEVTLNVYLNQFLLYLRQGLPPKLELGNCGRSS